MWYFTVLPYCRITHLALDGTLFCHMGTHCFAHQNTVGRQDYGEVNVHLVHFIFPSAKYFMLYFVRMFTYPKSATY